MFDLASFILGGFVGCIAALLFFVWLLRRARIPASWQIGSKELDLWRDK
mgnify:CR=1 FL=1